MKMKRILILLAALCLVVLTQTTGRCDPAAGSRLVLVLLVPVALVVLGISLWQPEETYERGAFIRSLQNQLTAWVDGIADGGAVGSSQYRSALSLAAQGEKTETHTPVMDVTSSRTGELYLRGQAYTVYTGTHWENDARTQVPDGVDSFAIGRYLANTYPSDTVKIETRRAHTLLFTPYHTMLGAWYQNIQNDTCVFSEADRYQKQINRDKEKFSK